MHLSHILLILIWIYFWRVLLPILLKNTDAPVAMQDGEEEQIFLQQLILPALTSKKKNG